ncbi:MAG: hypothetical protein AB9856_09635 [Cellulosilyticaceae bacterium]
MNIQMQGSSMMKGYSVPFFNQNKADKVQTDALTINAAEVKARQNHNKQDQTKYFYEQIEKIKESIQKVQADENLPGKIKADQLKQMRKEMLELQQQLAKVQEQEKTEKLKVEQEKRAKEDEKKLTPEEREKKVHEAQQKMLSGIAVAVNKVEKAVPAYNKVKEYTTKAKLGMGSKYGGNLSAAEVGVLFSKAAQYGKEMMQSLNEAKLTTNSVGKALEAYQSHKKKDEQEED